MCMCICFRVVNSMHLEPWESCSDCEVAWNSRALWIFDRFLEVLALAAAVTRTFRAPNREGHVPQRNEFLCRRGGRCLLPDTSESPVHVLEIGRTTSSRDYSRNARKSCPWVVLRKRKVPRQNPQGIGPAEPNTCLAVLQVYYTFLSAPMVAVALGGRCIASFPFVYACLHGVEADRLSYAIHTTSSTTLFGNDGRSYAPSKSEIFHFILFFRLCSGDHSLISQKNIHFNNVTCTHAPNRIFCQSNIPVIVTYTVPT